MHVVRREKEYVGKIVIWIDVEGVKERKKAAEVVG